VNCVFENKTKLNADEWAFACGTTHQVFASRELVALVISGLGFFGLVNSRVERLHVSAANYSCQGRLWNGRVQVCYD
jgi:hypothetical protein